MKKKIVYLMSAMVLTGATAMAQTTFGVRAGGQMSNITGKNFNGDKVSNKMTPGFHVGVNAEIPVGTGSYFQPGILFGTKGAQIKDMLNSDRKVTINYLEIPLNYVYKPELGSGKLLLGFGPYAAFNIGGKFDNSGISTYKDKILVKKDISAADALVNYAVRPLEFGANALFGYEFAVPFSIQANFQLGLTQMNPTIDGKDAGKTNLKNSSFGLSLGYRF